MLYSVCFLCLCCFLKEAAAGFEVRKFAQLPPPLPFRDASHLVKISWNAQKFQCVIPHSPVQDKIPEIKKFLAKFPENGNYESMIQGVP